MKKIIYIILVVILWALIGLILFGLSTLALIKIYPFIKSGIIFWGYIYSPIPEYILWLFVLVGGISGYFVGLKWWKWVYIEHKHWRNRVERLIK